VLSQCSVVSRRSWVVVAVVCRIAGERCVDDSGASGVLQSLSGTVRRRRRRGGGGGRGVTVLSACLRGH